MSWKTMDTAPKDGTRILVINGWSCFPPACYLVYWGGGFDADEHQTWLESHTSMRISKGDRETLRYWHHLPKLPKELQDA